MTTTYAALAALRQEVEDAITALDPNYNAMVRFRPRPTQDRTTRFEEAPPGDRLFEMLSIEVFAPITFGAANRHYQVTIPIKIWYQMTEGWSDALHDDIDKIAEYFRDNATTASGVSMRVVDQSLIQVEPLPDDPWQIVTMAMITVLDISP